MNVPYLPGVAGTTVSPNLSLPRADGRGAEIRVRGLRKSFGQRDVLRGLDLDIPAGQFVAIGVAIQQ